MTEKIIEFFDELGKQTHIIIDNGDGSFTSYHKEDWDAQQDAETL